MSGAILGWGIDLGQNDSPASKLFDDPKWYDLAEQQWDVYCYGPGHNRAALLLERSVVVKDEETKDFSASNFVSVTLGSSGFPVMDSQPDSEEIDILKRIVQAVRPDAGTVELSLQLLLLPAE